MSTSLLSAGEPGALGCSQAATGSKGRKPRACAAVRTRQHCGLSFWTITETARGRHLRNCPFDVPAQSYGDGFITGLRKAVEFFEALARPELSFGVGSVLSEAFVASQESSHGHSRRGAGCGFLHALKQSLHAAAPMLNVREWAESQINAMQQFEEGEARRRAERNQDFASRMRSARAAKRAAAQSAAGQRGAA